MTSRSLFFKLIKQEWKQKIWCPVILFISFFLALEIQLLIQLQDIEDWPKRYEYSIAHFFANRFLAPDINLFFTIASAASGIVCALGIFSYIHNRQKLDLFHCLPVKRSVLFLSKLTSGLLFYVVPAFIHLLVCLGIASVKHAASIHGYKNIVGFFVAEFLIYTVFFISTVFCMMLTGRIIISILAVCVILPYSSYLYWLKQALYGRFFYSAIPSYISPYWPFSPVTVVLNLIDKLDAYRYDNMGISYHCILGDIIFLLFLSVIYGCLSYLLYKKRPTEVAGNPIAFSFMEPVVKIIVVIPLALVSGEFFADLYTKKVFNWYIFGLIFGFFMASLAMEAIFRMNIKGVFKHWQNSIFNGICLVLLIVIMKYDVLGYNTYVPAENEIESMSCSIEGLLDTYGSYTMHNFHNPRDYRFEYIAFTDYQNVYKLAKKLAKDGLQIHVFEYYDGIEETQEYKEIKNKEENYKYIAFKYQLKNGKTIYREYIYDLTDTEAVEYVSAIFNDGNYKLGSMMLLRDGWNMDIKSVQCESMWNWQREIMITPEQKGLLIDAYQSDLMKLTFEEVLNSEPIGMMEFSYKIKTLNMWGYCGDNMIYPTFTKTIQLMKEWGYDFGEVPDVEHIEEIEISDFRDRYVDEEDNELVLTYNDTDQISDLIENLNYFQYRTYAPCEYLYDVKVTYFYHDEKQIKTFALDRNSVPIFLENDYKELIKNSK